MPWSICYARSRKSFSFLEVSSSSHRDGRKTTVVREVVRINHNQNCLLHHAPADTPDLPFAEFGKAKDVPTAAVPIHDKLH